MRCKGIQLQSDPHWLKRHTTLFEPLLLYLIYYKDLAKRDKICLVETSHKWEQFKVKVCEEHYEEYYNEEFCGNSV